MPDPLISAADRVMAQMCALCPVCRHARKRQKGFAFSLVKNIEVTICPFCKAYERVHGRKAHDATGCE